VGGNLLLIKSQVRNSLTFVGTMTPKAFISQDWPDITAEVNAFGIYPAAAACGE
jgi:hypothetical protein